MRLIPNNWHEFQHYKHRSPPWIKFHKKLLDNMLYHRLPIASKALAPMLWLLASESENGEINKTVEEIAFRLRMSEKEIENGLKPLIDNGFFSDASNVIAICVHDATTEKRREEKSIVSPEGVSHEVFLDYLKLRKGLKAPVTDTAIKGLAKEANKANMTLEQVMILCCQNGWRGFKAEWISKQQPTQKVNFL